jgi:hypothetical protein
MGRRRNGGGSGERPKRSPRAPTERERSVQRGQNGPPEVTLDRDPVRVDRHIKGGVGDPDNQQRHAERQNGAGERRKDDGGREGGRCRAAKRAARATGEPASDRRHRHERSDRRSQKREAESGAARVDA